MTVNENLVKYIFSIRNIIKHGTLLFLMLAAISTIILFCVYIMYNKVYNNYLNVINVNTVNTLQLDFPHRVLYNCKLISCKAIVMKDEETDKYYTYKLIIDEKNNDRFELIESHPEFHTIIGQKFDQDYNIVIPSI